MARFHKLPAWHSIAEENLKRDGLGHLLEPMTSRATAPAPKAASLPKPKAAADRAADMRIGVERTAATAAERARWAKVFASKASVGRERDCATLLASPKAFGAEFIIGFLAEKPTGATDAKKAANIAATDAVWDRANGVNARTDTLTAADAVWDKARAGAGGR